MAGAPLCFKTNALLQRCSHAQQQRLHQNIHLWPRLLLLPCPRAAEIAAGEAITFDAREGHITRADGSVLPVEPIPGFLLDMVDAGGLLPQLKKRFA